MVKLSFIMSDSKAFLRDEVLRITEEWGFNKSNVTYVEEWTPTLASGAVSLFGDISITHLDLSDSNKLKAFVKLMRDKKTEHMFEGNWFGEGLIITSTHARGTKKIEDSVKAAGGKVHKKAKPEEMKKKLLGRTFLSKDAKSFLDSYAGDDYQILIGVINQVESMTKEEQEKLTIDDLIVRLPSKPGSLPPWEFVNPMMEGNAKKAIELYERSVEGSHVLVTMQLARRKLQLLYRLKLLQLAGIRDSKKQAEAIGERNGPNIWITAKVAQRLDVSTTEYLAKLALHTEAGLKGHSSADPHILFKNFIAAACLSIKYNRVLPLNMR